KVWNLTKESPAPTLGTHKGAVRALAYSGDGKSLASASEDGTVKLWDLSPNRALPLMNLFRNQARLTLTGHGGAAQTLAYSVGGRTLVSGGQDGSVIIWDPANGQRRAMMRTHREGVIGAVLHPRCEHLITAGA